MANAALKNLTRRGTINGNRARDRDTGDDSAPFHVSDVAPMRKPRTALPELGQEVGPRSPRNAPQPVSRDRPRTAGGDRSSSKKHVHNRQTKDDLHYNAPLTHDPSRIYFKFPYPSPQSSIISTSARGVSPSPPKEDRSGVAVGSTIADFDAMLGDIGMALGSPSHQPVSYTHAWSDGRNDSPELIDAPAAPYQMARSKSKKWKLLGLFGKKSPEKQPFYQVSHQEPREYAPLPSPPPSARARVRGNTISEKATAPRIIIQRAQTLPMKPLVLEPNTPPTPEMTPPKKDKPEIKLDGGPLLDVEIPSIEMERYSIMFGSFLKSAPPQRKSGALLARRQATLDKLKTVNDEVAEFEQREADIKQRLLHPRRATSPQPTKSPAFSLFPRTPNESSSSIPRRSPLQRSNTSPAALSPNCQTFAEPGPNRPESEKHIVMLEQSPDMRATLSSPWSADEVHLVLESPAVEEVHDAMPLKPTLSEPEWEMIPRPLARDDSSVANTHSQSKAAAAQRPSTSHISSKSSSSFDRPSMSRGVLQSSSTTDISKSHVPTQLSKSRSAADDVTTDRSHPRNRSLNSNPVQQHQIKRRPVRADSGVSVSFSPSQTPKSSISGSRPTPQEAEELIRSAAELSIARQISVSREQRHMLTPLQARIAQAAAVGAGSGKGDKVVVSEKKHLMPVLIDVGGSRVSTSGRDVGGKGHVHKKSEVVVIEGI